MNGVRPTTAGRLQAAGPRLRHGGRLLWAFEEDALTAAWDAVARAGLAPGTRVLPQGFDVPAWWWAATGLAPAAADAEASDAAVLRLRACDTAAGPVVLLGPASAVEDAAAAAAARALLEAATDVDDAAAARVAGARDETPREADFPLGAYVSPQRHDEVLAERLRGGPARVVTWTRVAAGAAPSEFLRLQDAHGDYVVALVQRADGTRTVGLWAGAGAPEVGAACAPVLRRLLRQQGAWRHGAWFAPL